MSLLTFPLLVVCWAGGFVPVDGAGDAVFTSLMILDGVILHLEISANSLLLSSQIDSFYLMVNQQNNKFNWIIFRMFCHHAVLCKQPIPDSGSISGQSPTWWHSVNCSWNVVSGLLFGDLALSSSTVVVLGGADVTADVRVTAPLWLSHGNNLITITQFYHSTPIPGLGLLSFVLPALCFPSVLIAGWDHPAMCDPGTDYDKYQVTQYK